MAEELSETFAKPPIQEALIDMRVHYTDGFDFLTIEKMHESIKDLLPVKLLKHSTTLEFQKDGDAPTEFTHKDGIEGFIFRDNEEKHVLQVGRSGFTLSFVNNYSGWAELLDMFQKFWTIFCSIATISEVNRVGLRYINNINLPKPIHDLSEWMTTLPTIGSGVTESFSELFMRLVFDDGEDKCIITEVINPATQSDAHQPFILDIDTFWIGVIKPEDTTKQIETLSRLRKIKNRVFLNSLSDKTKELLR